MSQQLSVQWKLHQWQQCCLGRCISYGSNIACEGKIVFKNLLYIGLNLIETHLREKGPRGLMLMSLLQHHSVLGLDGFAKNAAIRVLIGTEWNGE